MRRKLTYTDYSFIAIGLVAFCLGVNTMLKIQTVILPSWFLAVMYGAVLVLISIGIAKVITLFTKSNFHILTAASIIVTLVCSAFYISEYRPSNRIYVPNNFSGQVKLFRSRLADNQLHLNQYGVGYITDRAYRKGFKPVIYQNGKDITDRCKNLSQGSLAFAGLDGTSLGPFSYVGFTIGDSRNDTIWNDLKKAIESKLIDTAIILK
jgi:hypothetical protein